MSSPGNSASPPKPRAHLVAGFAGGLCSAAILQPLDLLKTRVQQAKLGSNSVIQIIKQMPVKNLWVGTLPSVLRTSIGSSLYLTGLSSVRNYLNNQTVTTKSNTSRLPQLNRHKNLVTGSVVRAAVGILTMPITVVKTRYESSLHNYASLKEAVVDIYKDRRLKGFFLGCGSTIARDAPYAGLYVLMYEDLKSALAHSDFLVSSKFHSLAVNSVSAMAAASTATLATTPFDTIKTRIQIDPSKYPNFRVAAGYILQNEGVLVLFRGVGLRLVRKTLSSGIAWGIYEELLRFG